MSNGRGKCFSNEFSEYLKEHGIQTKYLCSYSPHQNGVGERKNKHIVEITCAMLNQKNLPIYFWAEAIVIVVYIMNPTPHNDSSWHDTQRKIHMQETRCLTP
jgi:hypothetical protein